MSDVDMSQFGKWDPWKHLGGTFDGTINKAVINYRRIAKPSAIALTSYTTHIRRSTRRIDTYRQIHYYRRKQARGIWRYSWKCLGWFLSRQPCARVPERWYCAVKLSCWGGAIRHPIIFPEPSHFACQAPDIRANRISSVLDFTINKAVINYRRIVSVWQMGSMEASWWHF